MRFVTYIYAVSKIAELPPMPGFSKIMLGVMGVFAVFGFTLYGVARYQEIKKRKSQE